MNIFQDLEDILAYKKTEQSGSVMDLLRLAADIRAKLGSRGHLLERYLSDMFQVLSASSSFQASVAGFEASAKLRKLCFHVMDSKNACTQAHGVFHMPDSKKKLEEHPFYPVVKKHFKEHPDTLWLRFTAVYRHYSMLSQEFLQFSLRSFMDEEKYKISCAVGRLALDDLYDKIAAIAGEAPMEQLNCMLKEQFLTVPVSIGFTYGLSYALVDSLTHVDNETGKQIFQLLMDECSK